MASGRQFTLGLLRKAGCFALLCAGLAGCATQPLDAARYHFYRGMLDSASARMVEVKPSEKDLTLYLMERGTVEQARGNYETSSSDFIRAADELARLETYSVSKGTASMVINDQVQSFIGTPYERSLLHTFTAINHLSRGDWDNAAVEARRIIQRLDPGKTEGYPLDAYSRYMAGFALEMIDDPSNAALQYRLAGTALPHLEINENTGRIRPLDLTETNQVKTKGTPAPEPWPEEKWENELICFILLERGPGAQVGWGPSWSAGSAPYAEIHADGKLLGRSYNLADTHDLAFKTAEKQALGEALKTGTRIVLKEATAQAVSSATDNAAAGDLVRLILIGLLERPDIRRWETLPRWLQVARVPCPPDLEEYDVIVRTPGGLQQCYHVKNPISRRRNKYFSFFRDLPLTATLPSAAGSR